jgi:uncharacterized protein (TIGR02118 family)
VIQVITLLRRRPGTTHDEFMRHWREVHGPLIASLPSSHHIRRYEQFEVHRDTGAEEPDFDGVTIQTYDSVEDFRAQIAAPDQGPHRDDVARFLDTRDLKWVIVDEPVVIIGDERGGDPPAAAPSADDALRRWDAHRQITDLIHAYADLIDAPDLPGLAALLEHAGVGFETAPGVEHESASGGGAFVAALQRANIVHPDGTFRTKHVVTNVRVEVDADLLTARATSYVTVLQQTPDLPLQPIYAGRYRDSFAVVDGAWRFTRRTMVADLLGDLSQHLVSGRVPT